MACNCLQATHFRRTFASVQRTYFTTDQVAEMFQVPSRTVRRWIRQRRIDAVDIAEGSRSEYRIPEAAVVRFDEQRRKKAAS